LLKKIALFLEMIKFEHTLFAMPFAIISMFLAQDGWPGLRDFVLIVLSLVFARTAAMFFNRWADFKLDAENPRTAKRALPNGKVKPRTVLGFTIIFSGLFIATTFLFEKKLAFYLAPLALAIVLTYSFSKRFTTWTHFWLGASLALAPIGAWIAIRGEIAIVPLLLGLAVCLWTAGFDIIYATQDVEFDRKNHLYSIPAKWGISLGLKISTALHLLMVGVLFLLLGFAHLGVIYIAGVTLVAVLLIYEHTIVKADSLARVNVAFFTVNGFVSLGLMGASILDILV
jgi:4-hydroxybenzoate polyprenyltransferase